MDTHIPSLVSRTDDIMRLQLSRVTTAAKHNPLSPALDPCIVIQRRWGGNDKLAPLVAIGGTAAVVALAIPAMGAGAVASAVMVSKGYAPFGMTNMLVTSVAFFAGMRNAELFWSMGLPAVLFVVVVILIMIVPVSCGYVLSKFYALLAVENEHKSSNSNDAENRE